MSEENKEKPSQDDDLLPPRSCAVTSDETETGESETPDAPPNPNSAISPSATRQLGGP
jgi:hypothetical protein